MIPTVIWHDSPSARAKPGRHSWIYMCVCVCGVGEGATPFPGFLHFTLDPYLIVLSAKQGGIKYHFLSV